VLRFLYNLVWPLGLLFFLPRYLVKMFRRGGYRRKFAQRFGIYDDAVKQRLRNHRWIWLHAVSVGEVAIALKLARAILEKEPDARFALTVTTTTGFAFAEKNASSEIEVMYTPLDFWPVMHRAFEIIRPERVILVEAEVWPNMVAETRSRNIPVALVNARLSPRSRGRFQRFRWVVAPMFRLLDVICVPDEADIEAWADLGARPNRIRHTGSIKFDPGPVVAGGGDPGRLNASISSNIAGFNRPVLFGGSTHPGEEAILARVFLRLRSEFPQVLLFLAPRHVERAREVKREMEKFSLGCSFTTEIEGKSNIADDCLILDRTGELRSWYPIATVVFVGKSLAVGGGQNPVEPIVAGKPVILGPRMSNFALLARELISNDGAIEVTDEETLYAGAKRLLSDQNARTRLVENGQRVINVHRGATERTAELVLEMVKNK